MAKNKDGMNKYEREELKPDKRYRITPTTPNAKELTAILDFIF